MPVADACRQALWEGYHLLSNEQHRFEEPLVGYGLVIYDNWCRELKKETNQNLENIEEARHMRRGFEWMLGRSRELEREALESWAAAMENKE